MGELMNETNSFLFLKLNKTNLKKNRKQMDFYGLLLQGGLKATKIKAESVIAVKLAALDTTTPCDELVPVIVEFNDDPKTRRTLCTLSKQHALFQEQLQLSLVPGEIASFHLNCKKGRVHLTGYQMGGGDNNEETESEIESVEEGEDEEEETGITKNEKAKSVKDEKEKVVVGKPRNLEGGVVVNDFKLGDGSLAVKDKHVHVYYTGKLDTGKQFDSCVKGKPFRFRLGRGQVIRGWDLGVEGMRVGGKRRIIVPPEMGYGASDQGDGKIPGNSTLVFDVQLINIRPQD